MAVPLFPAGQPGGWKTAPLLKPFMPVISTNVPGDIAAAVDDRFVAPAAPGSSSSASATRTTLSALAGTDRDSAAIASWPSVTCEPQWRSGQKKGRCALPCSDDR